MITHEGSNLVPTNALHHCLSVMVVSFGAGGLSTREVDRRPGHPANSGHRGCFSVKKAGAVFVDLTAAYGTVNRGLTCKLLQLLPDTHMVCMIMEMVGNRNFNLTTGNGKQSRLRRLTNGVPQGSVLAPLLFSIYISDMPTTVSRKYAYADHLVIMHADGDWEGVLSKDIAIIGEYLQTWKLKLSTTKMVSAVFQLNNKEAECELKVNYNNEIPPFGVTSPNTSE